MLFFLSESTKKIWMLGAEKNLAAYTLGAIICSALTVANPFFLGLFIDNLVYDGKPQIYFLILVSNAFLCWYLNRKPFLNGDTITRKTGNLFRIVRQDTKTSRAKIT